ncbi:YrbL family protein [Vibrio sagamiensis]|uniref:Protein kinase domain-containing protein n=1 Tax=Vibrio sagamiensis NBRC 104589 TaxID=1219064 RepID=A0A511QJE8_9VIBR|nr:YrbL family protein [Vibrio sagamiensis]GEM77453.1 hypothetical protein VSA01S_35650 [Vibrio sagamiensis NBRC 104589]
MNEKLKLSHKIGSGNWRCVYLHPENKNKCVKVLKSEMLDKQETKADINQEEHDYFTKYADNIYAPNYYGKVEVEGSEGTAICFELIRDAAGQISKRIDKAIECGDISKEKAIELCKEAYQYFCINGILVHDSGMQNILLQKRHDCSFKFYQIDGFGVKRNDFLYKLRVKFKLFASYKTNKQLTSLIKRIELL